MYNLIDVFLVFISFILGICIWSLVVVGTLLFSERKFFLCLCFCLVDFI